MTEEQQLPTQEEIEAMEDMQQEIAEEQQEDQIENQLLLK